MPAISVVMPVYNTQEYVAKAIESILAQTFTDFEFLIIDNGSTDNSGKIIDKYAVQDDRIRVIRNSQNVFIAEARNAAMSQVTGEYLCFIDSDDYVLPDMLETMYTRAIEHDAQYVVAGFYMDYIIGDNEYSYAVCPDDRNFTQQEFRKNAIDYLVRTLLTVPWNKLYSINYLREHNIQFRNTKLEDHHFNMDILMDIDRVSMISKPFYHYNRSRIGTDSQLVYNQFLNQKKRDHIAHTMAVYEHWGISDKETMAKLADYHLGRLVQCLTETAGNTQLDKKAKNEEIKTILSDKWTDFAIKNWSKGSIKLRLMSFSIRYKSLFLCKLTGRMISLLQKKFPSLFYKLRNTVAQKGSVSQ